MVVDVTLHQIARISLRIVDSDGQTLPTTTNLVQPNSTQSELQVGVTAEFRTLSAPGPLSIRLSVSAGTIGQVLTVNNVTFSEELSAPLSKETVATIVVHEGHRATIDDAIRTLLPQVSLVRLYTELPAESLPVWFASHPRITISEAQFHDYLGDALHFHHTSEDRKSFRYHLIAAGELLYSHSFVSRLVHKLLDGYAEDALLGLGGTVLTQAESNTSTRSGEHVAGSERNWDSQVHILDPQAIFYSFKTFPFARYDTHYRGLAHVYMALVANSRRKPLIAAEHNRDWVVPHQRFNKTALARSYSNELSSNFGFNAAVENNVSDFILKHSYPIVMPPSLKKRVLVIFGSSQTGIGGRQISALRKWYDQIFDDRLSWSVIVGHTHGLRSRAIQGLAFRTAEVFHVDLTRRSPCEQHNKVFSLVSTISFDVAFYVGDMDLLKPGDWPTSWQIADAMKTPTGSKMSSFNRGPSDKRAGLSLFRHPLLVMHPGLAGLASYCVTDSRNPEREDEDFSRRVLRFVRDGSSPVAGPLERGSADLTDTRGSPLTGSGATNFSFDAFFPLRLVLTMPNQRSFFDQVQDSLGFQSTLQHFRAVDASEQPYLSEWQKYNASARIHLSEGADLIQIKWAVDWYRMMESETARVEYEERKTQRRTLTLGGYGYSLSYISAVRQAMAQDSKSVVIFDSDARFHTNFESAFSMMASQLPNDWMVVYLGAMQFDWSPAWIRAYSENLYLGRGSSIASHAVGINRNAYPLVLEFAQRFSLPIDVGALTSICAIFSDKCFTMFPNLVIQNWSLKSSIASSVFSNGAFEERAKKFRWNLCDYKLGGQDDKGLECSNHQEPLYLPLLEAAFRLHCPDPASRPPDWVQQMVEKSVCGGDAEQKQAVIASAQYQCGAWCIWDLRTWARIGWLLTPDCIEPFDLKSEPGHRCAEWFESRPRVLLTS